MAKSESIPSYDFDPRAPEVRDDPYRVYDALRSLAPVVYSPVLDEHILTSYEDVRDALVDHETFSNEDTTNSPMAAVKVMVTADEPAHGRQRRLVSKAFTPRRIAALEPSIRATANELVDKMIGAGRADLVTSFAYPLPVTIIAEMLGIPPTDQADFKRWADDLFAAVSDPDAHLERATISLMEFGGYIVGKGAERRAVIEDGGTPPDDLITALIKAEEDGHRLTDDEFVVVAMQLLSAGHETTTNLISTAVHLLCTHPAELEKLRADPKLIEPAVEEILRYESPAQGLWRRVKRDTEIKNLPIEAGSLVRVMFAAANRDPKIWNDPDEFDISRDPDALRQHVAFGFGIHVCLGAALARLEATVALETLFTRLPNVRLDPERQPERAMPHFLRGWESMPLVWDPPASK